MATDRLSATFAALADPTRRAILARLTLGETSVSELAQPFEMSLDRKSTRLNSSHIPLSRMPSSA